MTQIAVIRGGWDQVLDNYKTSMNQQWHVKTKAIPVI